jgi:peptidoglycan/xylan/chitin deacetylase (PgdA/CDA1 family)
MSTPYVLCYHAVSSSWPARLAIPEPLLASQLHALAERGFCGLTLADAERRRAAGTLPARAVVVTFDDGYASTPRAKPILDELGFPATVFVVSRFPDSGRLLAWPGVEEWSQGSWAAEMTPLGWDGLGELKAGGWEIGSHTVTHPRLPELSDDALDEELGRSRQTISDRLGECETVAYPYGLADARVARAAANAGYTAGVTLTSAHRADEPLLRPRIGLNRRDTGLRLRTKLSPAFLAFRRTRVATAAERLNGHLRNR